jgi:DNA polymerase V
MKKDKLTFLKPEKENSMGQWLIEQGISAGFPSPADDFKEIRISLDRELIKNKEATFYARVSGNSMENAGLSDGDLIVIDRSLNPENNKIAVCFIEGDFTVKRIVKKKGELYLKPENKNYKEIVIKEEDQLVIWGIVTYVIKKIK